VDQDHEYMTRALALAPRGEGRVHPNPMVGAVVVADGEVVGEGWHDRFGGPHAERPALEAAGARARGATLYVTLEPCAHHGKTPPCVEAILAAGVARVVVAMSDPDPRVDGRGIARLRAAGVEVTVGASESAARVQNAPFLQRHRTGRALVTLKLAASLDGRIAGSGGESRWISSETSRADVHALRARADAVLVGRGTVERDDPALTVRHVEGRNPVRIVLDSRGRLPADRTIFRDGAARTVHATLEGVKSPTADHWELPAGADGCPSLRELLARCAAEGLLHVLAEGGAALATSLVAGRLVDELRLYTAPIVLGSGESLP